MHLTEAASQRWRDRYDEGVPATLHPYPSLARFKVPRRVVFRDELPRNLIGKVLRRELRGEVEPDDGSVPGLAGNGPRPAGAAR